MITIVWQPDDTPEPQTLTWAEATRAQYDALAANWHAAAPDDVLTIPCRPSPGDRLHDYLFRAGRIRDISWGPS